MKKFFWISLGIGVAAWFLLKEQAGEPTPLTEWGAKNRASGKLDQAVGSVKQSFGESFGSENLANEGAWDQAKGAVKDTMGKAADAVSGAANDLTQ